MAVTVEIMEKYLPILQVSETFVNILDIFVLSFLSRDVN